MIESGGTVNLSHIWLTESPLVRVSEPYNSGPKLNQEYAIPTEVIPVKLRHVGSCFLVSYRRREFARERCAVSSLGGLAHARKFQTGTLPNTRSAGLRSVTGRHSRTWLLLPTQGAECHEALSRAALGRGKSGNRLVKNQGMFRHITL
jgi:hypothetical protein